VFTGVNTNSFSADFWGHFASKDNMSDVKLFILGGIPWYYADSMECRDTDFKIRTSYRFYGICMASKH
jgi:hypothetical protein